MLDFELSPRKDIPSWMAYATPVATILAALLVSGMALLALNVNPLHAYEMMFIQTLTTESGLINTINKAVPLILAGIAVYLPLKAQLWNIGAEGQLFVGAIAGTWIALNVSLPTIALIPLMFLGAGVAGALWIAIPAVLRAKWGINEIITTLLFVFIAGEMINYLVRGPMQEPGANFPHSAPLPAVSQMPEVPGLGFSVGIFLAIALVVCVYIVINHTRLGYEIAVTGANDRAAEKSGISKYKVYLFVFLAGGAFAGFAGISEIASEEGRLRASFDPGYGFTAIPIALLGRNGAFQVMLAATFFAVIFVGGSTIETMLGVPSAIVGIIQALIILFLLTAEFFKEYEVSVSLKGTSKGEPRDGADVEGGA